MLILILAASSAFFAVRAGRSEEGSLGVASKSSSSRSPMSSGEGNEDSHSSRGSSCRKSPETPGSDGCAIPTSPLAGDQTCAVVRVVWRVHVLGGDVTPLSVPCGACRTAQSTFANPSLDAAWRTVRAQAHIDTHTHTHTHTALSPDHPRFDCSVAQVRPHDPPLLRGQGGESMQHQMQVSRKGCKAV